MHLSARTIAWLLTFVALASLAANVLFAREAVQLYRNLQALRLDPLEVSRVAAAELRPATGAGALWVFFGDSRAAAWPGPGLAGIEVRNLGISGQTTEQVALRLDSQLLPLRPQRVLLQVGINDLKAIALFPDRAEQITNSVQRGIGDMVARLRAAGIEVVLTSVFPVAEPELARRPFWSAEAEAAIGEVNRHLASLAGPGVTVFDAAAVLKGGNGRVQPAYARDFLHLSPAGYVALNEALTRHLAPIGPAR